MFHNNILKLSAYFTKKMKEKEFLNLILEDNNEYLAGGKYSFTWTGKRKIYIKNKNTKEFLIKDRMQSNNSFFFAFKSIVDLFSANILKTVIPENKDGDINGELIMMTYRDNIKIFDFVKKVVINIMASDPITYNNIKQAHLRMNKHFRMTITKFNDHKYIYFENYLEFIPYNQWDKAQIESCIEEIFDSYKQYFSFIKSEHTATQKPDVLFEELRSEDFGQHVLFKELYKLLQMTPKKTMYPIVKGHGDLKFENILLANKEFYFIDLEFSSDYYFFYDVINFIFHEAMHGDYSYIELYLSGHYDEEYNNIFKVFNLDFEESFKLYYIAAYLVDRVYHFDMEVSVQDIDFESLLNKYYLTLKKILEMSK